MKKEQMTYEEMIEYMDSLIELYNMRPVSVDFSELESNASNEKHEDLPINN